MKNPSFTFKKVKCPKMYTAIDLYKENPSEIPEHSPPREKHIKFWEEKTGHRNGCEESEQLKTSQN